MKKRLLLITLFVTLLLLLVGCGNDDEHDFTGKVKVVYELEGGIYQNCERPVTLYYPFAEGTTNLITTPDALSKEPLTRAGYTLEGWYTQKIVAADGTVEYRNKWDFSTHKVSSEGVTLYAHWERNVTHTYEVCYRDENNEIVTLGSYEVKEGDLFDDWRRFANKRSGYTSLGTFRDEEGNAWDMTTGHPGGKTDLAVRLFPDYIEGNYAIIRAASDLKTAANKNLYLMNDIDLGGAKFGGFGDPNTGIYSGTILGNGYSIKNFTLTYGSSVSDLVTDIDLDEEGNLLCISLFDTLRNATLKDISFTDFSIEIKTSFDKVRKILVAPLAMKLESSTLENVTVSGEWKVTTLPSGFSHENLLVKADTASYYRAEDDSSRLTNVTVTFTESVTAEDA